MKIQIVYEDGDITINNRIERIKTIRNSLGIGLKDAKDLSDGEAIKLPKRNLVDSIDVVKTFFDILHSNSIFSNKSYKQIIDLLTIY